MIQPNEMKGHLPMSLHNGVLSTNTKVWEILVASRDGDLQKVKSLVTECPELIYAQYNYTPPIHFAVREGHIELVNYLLGEGAHDPSYKIYPFQDPLQTIARDRGFIEISALLDDYASNPSWQKYKGDNGEIHFRRTEQEKEFQHALSKDDIVKAEEMLRANPDFALDETFFWGEGVLTVPAQHRQFALVDLLMIHGARVPLILKWAQAYYFKFYDGAAHMMKRGMSANVMSWHEVTILHDMAQKGDIPKAELLITHGANLNTVEDEYQSTPLGMAARWGHEEMVMYLINKGADINKSGAAWSTPLAWSREKQFESIEKILVDAGAK